MKFGLHRLTVLSCEYRLQHSRKQLAYLGIWLPVWFRTIAFWFDDLQH